MAIKYYFAYDGAFGDARDGCVIDTAKWQSEDWEKIDSCGDFDRLELAREIAEARGGQVSDFVPVNRDGWRVTSNGKVTVRVIS